MERPHKTLRERLKPNGLRSVFAYISSSESITIYFDLPPRKRIINYMSEQISAIGCHHCPLYIERCTGPVIITPENTIEAKVNLLESLSSDGWQEISKIAKCQPWLPK